MFNLQKCWKLRRRRRSVALFKAYIPLQPRDRSRILLIYILLIFLYILDLKFELNLQMRKLCCIDTKMWGYKIKEKTIPYIICISIVIIIIHIKQIVMQTIRNLIDKRDSSQFFSRQKEQTIYINKLIQLCYYVYRSVASMNISIMSS